MRLDFSSIESTCQNLHHYLFVQTSQATHIWKPNSHVSHQRGGSTYMYCVDGYIHVLCWWVHTCNVSPSPLLLMWFLVLLHVLRRWWLPALASSSTLAMCTHGWYVSSVSVLHGHHLHRELVSKAVIHSAEWMVEQVGVGGWKQRLKVQSVVKVASRGVWQVNNMTSLLLASKLVTLAKMNTKLNQLVYV